MDNVHYFPIHSLKINHVLALTWKIFENLYDTSWNDNTLLLTIVKIIRIVKNFGRSGRERVKHIMSSISK